jgi:hypothetical protein
MKRISFPSRPNGPRERSIAHAMPPKQTFLPTWNAIMTRDGNIQNWAAYLRWRPKAKLSKLNAVSSRPLRQNDHWPATEHCIENTVMTRTTYLKARRASTSVAVNSGV